MWGREITDPRPHSGTGRLYSGFPNCRLGVRHLPFGEVEVRIDTRKSSCSPVNVRILTTSSHFKSLSKDMQTLCFGLAMNLVSLLADGPVPIITEGINSVRRMAHGDKHLVLDKTH